MTDPDLETEPTSLTVKEASERWLQGDELTTPELYPALNNLSAGFIYRRTLQAVTPDLPEYVTVTHNTLEDQLAISQWNMLWEAAQFRRHMFDEDQLPDWMAKIADQGDHNVVFVPRTRSRYVELSPLYHLLPKATLEKFGLPVLARGIWPYTMGKSGSQLDSLFPDDAEQRLARAWSGLIWKHLMPRAPMRGFTKDDPIRLLSHNLDFWIPPVTQVIHDRMSELPQGPLGEEPIDEPALLEDGSVSEEARITRPRVGSAIWIGEDDAEQARAEVIEAADATGNLRAILDAVKSHRIEDDFSSHWNYVREDFERKLHHKRAKTKVTFVELPDGPALQSPETEVIGNMVCNDFLAMLDPKDRHIVVLLASGHSQLTEVAQILGYANHSPVSKRLTRVRKLAETMLAE